MSSFKVTAFFIICTLFMSAAITFAEQKSSDDEINEAAKEWGKQLELYQKLNPCQGNYSSSSSHGCSPGHKAGQGPHIFQDGFVPPGYDDQLKQMRKLDEEIMQGN
tara:strand:+ start:268 stop:585 length:318 start_codon:yes stop_codon:yes gene_type:complete